MLHGHDLERTTEPGEGVPGASRGHAIEDPTEGLFRGEEVAFDVGEGW